MNAFLKRKRILIIEDDPRMAKIFARDLRLEGATVLVANNVESGFDLFKRSKRRFDIAIIDLLLPLRDGDNDRVGAGIELADAILDYCSTNIKRKRPLMIGMSVYLLDFSKPALSLRFDAFYDKNDHIHNKKISLFVFDILKMRLRELGLPKILMVHGHDNNTKLELKNFLQNELQLGEPIILHEQPNVGRTIIEKFEQESLDVELVFILMTPDDKGVAIRDSNNEKRRARQNVIFEMGYFFGVLGRRSGKVIVLNSGRLEIPSDISGLVVIDISKGIRYAGEDIRKEIQGWLEKRNRQHVNPIYITKQ